MIVNRVWAQHFGRGLVTTPSDFGVRADAPSHPELLDYLAREFVADGWSLKRLHKRLVTTRRLPADGGQPRRRRGRPRETSYSGGCLQRGWISSRCATRCYSPPAGSTAPCSAAASTCSPTPPPRAARSTPASTGKTLPGTLRTFDFASPDAHSPGRFSTTVPQQALFFLNSPFAVQQAKAVAARPEVQSAKTPEAKVIAITRIVLGRTPRPEELVAALEFVKEPTKKGDPTAWDLYAQALLMSNEFLFVD